MRYSGGMQSRQHTRGRTAVQLRIATRVLAACRPDRALLNASIMGNLHTMVIVVNTSLPSELKPKGNSINQDFHRISHRFLRDGRAAATAARRRLRARGVSA